jgi:hypothetical protein
LVDEIKYFTRGVAFACFSKLLIASELLEQITSQGLDFIPELVRILDNVAIRAEHETILALNLANIWWKDRDMRTAPYQRRFMHGWLGHLCSSTCSRRWFLPISTRKRAAQRACFDLTLAEIWFRAFLLAK